MGAGWLASGRGERTIRRGAALAVLCDHRFGRSLNEPHQGLKAVMRPSSLLPQSCAVCCPTAVMANKHTMRIMANITEYSTAVGPSSSRRNLSSFVMGVFDVSESDAGEVARDRSSRVLKQV